MATLILNGRAVSARLEGEHVAITRHDIAGSPTERLPLPAIARVLVVGRPAIAFPVLAAFMERGIPCCFVDGAGRFRGALDCHTSAFHGRRRGQYLCSEDPSFRLGIARRLVSAKIRNARRVLRRLAANRPVMTPDDDARERVARLANLLHKVRCARTLEELRGIEGCAAATHFSVLGRFFPATLPFRTRSRHPPRDAANALLSWLYTLLLGEVVMALHAHGLDPSAGCFHQNGARAPALALDLMEPFRPVCGDLLACRLASHGILKADTAFEGSARAGVRLNELGRRLALKAFAQTMERAFRSRVPACSAMTLRGAIQTLVADYVKTFSADTPDLRPFLLP